MRSALEHGTSDIKQLFRGYHPGRNWIFGLEQLYMRFPANELPAEGEEDVRRWQPLVPQLISSFQLTRDILLALPLGDHVALERDLYTLGSPAGDLGAAFSPRRGSRGTGVEVQMWAGGDTVGAGPKRSCSVRSESPGQCGAAVAELRLALYERIHR